MSGPNASHAVAAGKACFRAWSRQRFKAGTARPKQLSQSDCSALLSHAAMSAFAATFTPRAGAISHADGALPPLGELHADAGEAPSPLAGCLPASCTSHRRWPPGYKWLACPCPAAPRKQVIRGDKPRRWRKGARKQKMLET